MTHDSTPVPLSTEEIKAEPFSDSEVQERRQRLSIRPCGDLGWRLHEEECRWFATLDQERARADAERDRAEKAQTENANLKRQLTYQRDNNHKRNLALDALHFVWCNGGCESGVHRWDEGEVTLDIVKAAVLNTRRLVTWFINARYRAYPNYPRSLMPKEDLEALKTELDLYGSFAIAQLEAERGDWKAVVERAVTLLSEPDSIKLMKFSKEALEAKGLLMVTLTQGPRDLAAALAQVEAKGENEL